MAEDNTGAVRFVGQADMICSEAMDFDVADAEGNNVGPTALMQPDYVISGIPQNQLHRWLLNGDFRPEDSAAEQAKESLKSFTAQRINGSLLSAHEVEQRRTLEAERAASGEAELPMEKQRVLRAQPEEEEEEAKKQERLQAERLAEKRKQARQRREQAENEETDNSGEEGDGA